jgi:hypothetical protein
MERNIALESESREEAFIPSEKVTVPIGLEFQGKRYREFVVDEMSGVDEENIGKRSIRNNGAKAMTVLLRRAVVGITDVTEPKRDTEVDLLPEGFIRNLYAVDRDYLFLAIRTLSMDDPKFEQKEPCPSCRELFEDDIDIRTLEVYDWPEDEIPEVPITVPRGIMLEGNKYHHVWWHFPNGIIQENLAGLPRQRMTTAMISSCISRVDGYEGKLDTETAKRLRTRERQFIVNQARELTPGVDLRRDCACEECGHEWEGEVDLAGFFSTESRNTQQTSKGGKKKGRRKRKRSLRR